MLDRSAPPHATQQQQQQGDGNDLMENIAICIDLASHLRRTLGPFGRDILLLQQQQQQQQQPSPVMITNDGACLLTHLPLRHPAALLLREVCQSQDRAAGDGTTSTLLLAAQLLQQLQQVITAGTGTGTTGGHYQNVSMPTAVISAVLRSTALPTCMRLLHEAAIHVQLHKNRHNSADSATSLHPSPLLKSLVETCIGSKIIGAHSAVRTHFAHIIASAAEHVTGTDVVNTGMVRGLYQRIFLHRAPAGEDLLRSQCLHDTLLIPIRAVDSAAAAHLDIQIRHLSLESHKRPLRVLLCRLDTLCTLRKRGGILGARVRVDAQHQVEQISQHERQSMENICRDIIACGADIVLNGSPHPVHPLALDLLWNWGKVLCLGRLSHEIMDACTEALQCPIVSSTQDISSHSVLARGSESNCNATDEHVRTNGQLGTVASIGRFGLSDSDDNYSANSRFIRLGLDPHATSNKVSSIVIRAPTDTMAAECERSVHDAIRILEQVTHSATASQSTLLGIVAGGGCMYMHLATYIRTQLHTYVQYDGKEQLVMEAFARALEQMPVILAQNAGLDVSKVVAELRRQHMLYWEQKQQGEHNDKGISERCWKGLDLSRGIVCDMIEKGNAAEGGNLTFRVAEPVTLIKGIIRHAIDAAEMILRIDHNVYQRPQRNARELGIV